MLSGIKVGKKKAKVVDNNVDVQRSQAQSSTSSLSNNDELNTTATSASAGSTTDNNAIVAEQLRRSLQRNSQPLDRNTGDDGQSTSSGIVVKKQHVLSMNQANEEYQPTSITKRATALTNETKDESDMTVLDLLRNEKAITSKEQERSMYKVYGKKRGRVHGDNDNDDDDEWQTHLYTSNDSKAKNNDHNNDKGQKTNHKNHHPLQHRLKDMQMNTNCFWWIQSSNFVSYRLIPLPTNIQTITLIMTPPLHSVKYGEHFYIVPVDYTPSFTSCDQNVWEEVRLVQSMLRSIAKTKQSGVIFFETFLGSNTNRSSKYSNSNNNNIWQARMEAVFVPISRYYDAALYYRTAMMDEMEEYGTNPKLIHTSPMKPLHHSVPKNFPYFFVEYETDNSNNNNNSNNSNQNQNNGYVLMIESEYKFLKTFGVDTIASMMDIEPIRVRNQQQPKIYETDERRIISNFIQQYSKLLK